MKTWEIRDGNGRKLDLSDDERERRRQSLDAARRRIETVEIVVGEGGNQGWGFARRIYSDGSVSEDSKPRRLDEVKERLPAWSQDVEPEFVRTETYGKVYARRRSQAEKYRAYDTTTEWSGVPRATVAAAERDAARHNAGCEAQGGYGSAILAQRDDGRLATLDGEPVWPPSGRSNGAAVWVE